jgi:hypothetical protein
VPGREPAWVELLPQVRRPAQFLCGDWPFRVPFCRGHLYRTAAEQPRRLIVVVGMWIIFGMMALAGIMIAVMSWSMGSRFGALAGIGLLGVSVFLIGKTTRNYRKRPARKPQDEG